MYRVAHMKTPEDSARQQGHAAMTAWLARIRAAGSWALYLSQPRYSLLLLRELSASGRARRERAFHGKELVLDLLFPGDQPQANKPRLTLPNSVFPLVVKYWWGGEV